MAVKMLPKRDLGQVNTLKRSQQRFSRRTVGSSFRIASIQSCHRGFGICQRLANAKLQQGQDSQANREQANEASRSLITLHVHGRERQPFPLQASKPTL